MNPRSKLMIAVLGLGGLMASSALASGWDCSATCLGVFRWCGRAVVLGQPQVTVGAKQSTEADAFRMLEESCERESDGWTEPVLEDATCQQDASLPDNDPATTNIGFVPPGGIGG